MTKIRKRKISSIFEKQPSTGFLRKKPEVVEIFLSEKLSCVPIKEVPSRSSKKYVMYDFPIREAFPTGVGMNRMVYRQQESSRSFFDSY